MITVRPKVTNKELKGVTLKRANTQCMAMPNTKKPGATMSNVISGSTPKLLDSW